MGLGVGVRGLGRLVLGIGMRVEAKVWVCLPAHNHRPFTQITTHTYLGLGLASGL